MDTGTINLSVPERNGDIMSMPRQVRFKDHVKMDETDSSGINQRTSILQPNQMQKLQSILHASPSLSSIHDSFDMPGDPDGL